MKISTHLVVHRLISVMQAVKYPPLGQSIWIRWSIPRIHLKPLQIRHCFLRERLICVSRNRQVLYNCVHFTCWHFFMIVRAYVLLHYVQQISYSINMHFLSDAHIHSLVMTKQFTTRCNRKSLLDYGKVYHARRPLKNCYIFVPLKELLVFLNLDIFFMAIYALIILFF